MLNLNHCQTPKQVHKTVKKTALIILTLSTTGCYMCGTPPNGQLFCTNNSAETQKGFTQFGSFPSPSNLKVVAEHSLPEQSPSFTGSAFIPAGGMQPFEATIAFPPPFTVSQNGFSNIAPIGSNIGEYSIELDDGGTEMVFPIISESNFFAWMDINANNMKDFFEPEVFHSQDMNNNSLLVVSMPNGGDNDSSNNNGNISFNMKIHMGSGFLINPMVVSNHTITANIQSVDPDTGGANNGAGVDPETLQLDTSLIIDLIYKNGFD